MILQQAHINFLFKQAKAAHPEECCGLFVGENNRVDQFYASQNVAAGDRTRRFEIDAKLRFDIMRERGERAIMGVYHSHPNGVPYPSDTDRRMVYEPDLIWIILTLEEIRAFRFLETKQDFEEIPIQVNL